MTPMPATSLAEALVRHRVAHGLSQAALAEELGVSQNSVYQWEKGGRVHARNMPALANLLGVEPAELASMVWTNGPEENEDDIIARLDRLEARQVAIDQRLSRQVAEMTAIVDQLDLLAKGGDDMPLPGDPRLDG